MNSIIEFISKNDSIIMTGLFVLIIILTAIVTIMDFVNKRNSKDSIEDEELIDFNVPNNETPVDNLVLNINEDIALKNETVVLQEEKKEPSVEVTEIKYVEDDEELE